MGHGGGGRKTDMYIMRRRSHEQDCMPPLAFRRASRPLMWSLQESKSPRTHWKKSANESAGDAEKKRGTS